MSRYHNVRESRDIGFTSSVVTPGAADGKAGPNEFPLTQDDVVLRSQLQKPAI